MTLDYTAHAANAVGAALLSSYRVARASVDARNPTVKVASDPQAPLGQPLDPATRLARAQNISRAS